MEKKLLKLYKKNAKEIKKLGEKFNDLMIVGPILISPPQKYIQQKKKLLIIGSDSSGWSEILPDIQSGIEQYKAHKLGRGKKNSPFWELTRKMEKAFGVPKYASIWVNMNKFDISNALSYTLFIPEMTECDYLLLEEIKILEPDMVIFLTNYINDFRICNAFEGVQFNEELGFKINDLAKLDHVCLPEETYRTYHPNYLKNKELESDLLEMVKKVAKKL